MIIKATKPEEVIPIIYVKDSIEEDIEISRDEWIQFLVEKVSDEKWGIWISRNDMGDINAYVVAVDNMHPPLTKSIMIVYVWSINHKALIEIQEAGEAWGKLLGATKITAKTNEDDQVLKAFGYKVTSKFVEKTIE